MTAPAPPEDEHLAALVARQAQAYGDRTFLTFGDGATLGFAQLAEQVERVRTHLVRTHGVAPGQRVAVVMKNSLLSPVTWLGILAAGAVAVPVNSRLGELDARFVLEHSGAVAAVVDATTEDLVRRAAPPSVRALVRASTLLGDPPGPPVDRSDLSVTDVANIQYTSGTTGFPKGCLLTHGYWQRMGAATSELFGLTERDTLLTSQPHSYIDPQWNVVAALRAGARLVLLDGFHPATFMQDVSRFGVTFFYCLGVMPLLLLKQPSTTLDLSALRRVFCSAIPPDRHAEIEQRWGAPWSEVFGMTETGVNIGVSAADHDRTVGTGSLGRALDHNEVAVVDPEGREVQRGEVGELVLRGRGFMLGYHRDPEATAAFFRQGWAHTGDLASLDEEGFVRFRGRLKDMIRRAGENVAAVEVEAALASHRSVAHCAVRSVPDPDLGEEIKAYVVLADGADADAGSLADFLRQRLAPFKVPRYWEFRESLPHTPSERVAKGQLEAGRPDWRVGTIDLRA